MSDNNSIRLKLPGRDKTITVTWSNEIEIVSERVETAPRYSYRWECDDVLTAGRIADGADTAGRDAGAETGAPISSSETMAV